MTSSPSARWSPVKPWTRPASSDARPTACGAGSAACLGVEVMTEENTGGLEFPCTYPVKAMVRTGPGVREQILETVGRHANLSESEDVRIRPSRTGRYESVTVTVTADSRDHLERIYTELRALDVVVMML
ncbi:MAG: DUF493 domain-containing protein [Wenzhouxiangella sp.]|nr:MAG: DUF493 domain-containing protein [Wenzhouxiangella sp.]